MRTLTHLAKGRAAVSFLKVTAALVSVAFIFLASSSPSLAQEKTPPNAAPQQEEVIRVSTELVQTDVTVIDKRGRVVEGLEREQFELRVDGRVVPISFFERVTAGADDEERKLAAARGLSQPAAKPGAAPATPLSRGRLLFFFVDDVHLMPDSLARTRKALRRFVDEQMRAGDLVAIVSTSGQIGFLQQLTDNKAVLREAIERLTNKRDTETYSGKVPISEADANRIVNHRDRELFWYLIEATQNEYQMGPIAAFHMVRNRIRQIDTQSRPVEQQTLKVLGSLFRSSASLPGRKLVFFISDGFVVDERKSSAPLILRQATDEAARVGAVVYTVDARGLTQPSGVDAVSNAYVDFSSRTGGRAFFDTKSVQEPLVTIAAETGGRAFLNNSSLNDAFEQGAREASRYYLLAWRPDSETQRAGQSRVSVHVKDRPDLRVQARLRFYSPPAAAKRESDSANVPLTPEEQLQAALVSLYPRTDLPLSLSAGFVNEPGKGAVLVTSMQLDGDSLGFEPQGQDEKASVDVLGVAIDDRGQISSFKQVLSVSREQLRKNGRSTVLWNQQLPLAPGLYQVRVAALDRQSGRAGSQMQWIEIPEPEPARLSMSSLFVGESKGTAQPPQSLPVNVPRRFARDSHLRFQAFIYVPNSGAARDLGLEVKVLGDERAALELPPGTLPAAGADSASRLPFTGEFPLGRLAPGRYTLQITAADPATKSSVTRQVNFVIE